MANILVIDLGTVPNDGTGDPLRTGGQDINANFAELNVKKLENGGFGGTAADLDNAITAIQANYVTTNTAQTITAQKTFNTLPQSILAPTNAADFVNKNYVDTEIAADAPTGLERLPGNGFAYIGQDRTKSVAPGVNSFDFLDNTFSGFPDTDYGAAATNSAAFGGGNKIPAGGFGYHFVNGAYNALTGGFANTALGAENKATNAREVVLAGYFNIGNTNASIGGMFAGGAFNTLGNYWGNALGTRLNANTKGAVHVGIASELITEGVTQADRRIFTVGIGDVQANAGPTFGDALFRRDGFRVRYNGVVEAPALTPALITAGDDSTLITKEYFNTNSPIPKEEQIVGSMINFGNVATPQVLDLSLYTVFVATIVTGSGAFTIANQPADNDSNTWQLMVKGSGTFTLPPEAAPVDGTPAYSNTKWNIYTFTKVFPSQGALSWNYVYTLSQIDVT